MTAWSTGKRLLRPNTKPKSRETGRLVPSSVTAVRHTRNGRNWGAQLIMKSEQI